MEDNFEVKKTRIKIMKNENYSNSMIKKKSKKKKNLILKKI